MKHEQRSFATLIHFDVDAAPIPRCADEDHVWHRIWALCTVCRMLRFGPERVAVLLNTLEAERVQPRHGCLGCPMVNGKCPHCGNETAP